MIMGISSSLAVLLYICYAIFGLMGANADNKTCNTLDFSDISIRDPDEVLKLDKEDFHKYINKTNQRLQKLKTFISQSYHRNFDCFIVSSTRALERGYSYRNVHNTSKSLHDLPTDFQYIINTYDNRTDEFRRADNKRRGRYIIGRSYEYWYEISKNSRNKTFSRCILNELDSYYNANKDRYKYNSLETVRERFAATMARTYNLVCFFHHKLQNEIGIVGEDLTNRYPNQQIGFLRSMFYRMPSFYFTKEHLDFLNILMKVVYTKGEYKVECIWAKNGLGIETAIPISSSCLEIEREMLIES